MKGLIVADWRTTKADRIRSAHAELVAARAEYDATVAEQHSTTPRRDLDHINARHGAPSFKPTVEAVNTELGCDAELDPGGIRDPLATYVVAWNQYIATLEAIRNEHVI